MNRQQPVCPLCGRVMSFREKDEQGACNDCSGGPADLGPLQPICGKCGAPVPIVDEHGNIRGPGFVGLCPKCQRERRQRDEQTHLDGIAKWGSS